MINAYTLFFGGFLLLGGRMSDLLGPRRVFVAGLLLFGVTSLVAGLSNSPEFPIGARAVQGLGGALLSPAARLSWWRGGPLLRWCRCGCSGRVR